MDRRLQLHELLCETLGSHNVYFEPPETIKMKYPCIVYSRGQLNLTTNFAVSYANDKLYNYRITYTIILISTDPDNAIFKRILQLPYCSFNRGFSQDNLNHDVFTLYY